MRRDRRGAWRFGRRAEWASIWFLRLKGYRILARNLRMKVGEVDIVARRGNTLAFVEVKARPAREIAAEAIPTRQRRRVIRGAQAFLATRPVLRGLNYRFDAILLSPWRLPLHIEGAWQTDEKTG